MNSNNVIKVIMKKIFMLTLSVILFSITTFAQRVLPDSVKIYPENTSGIVSFVFQTKNSPDAAFNNAKQWVAKNFKDYKQVVQMEDAASHTLVFKGKQPIGKYNGVSSRGFSTVYNLALEYTTTIECKDGKFRIKLEDIKPKGSFRLGGGKDTPIFLHFNDIDNLEKKRNDPKFDRAYITMMENMIPGTKETIADIVSSMAQSISYYDDF